MSDAVTLLEAVRAEAKPGIWSNGVKLARAGAVAQESRAQAVEAAQARQAAAARSQQIPLDNFRRAMGACMQSRGYTVG